MQKQMTRLLIAIAGVSVVLTLAFAQAGQSVATVLTFLSAVAAAVILDYRNRAAASTDVEAWTAARNAVSVGYVPVLLVLGVIAGVVLDHSHDSTTDEVGSCHSWPTCAFQTGYCHDKCTPPDLSLDSFDPNSGRDELDVGNGLTVTIINTHGVIAPSDDTLAALARNVDAAVTNRVFRDDNGNYWTLIWSPNDTPDADVVTALKAYLAQLAPNANPVTPAAANVSACNPDSSDSNVESCVGCPFCALQHGYCSDNCCSGSGIGPHICGMDGCMAAEPGHLDLEQTAQAARQFGEDRVRDLLADQGIHTLVADDGTRVPVGEVGKRNGCDCPFCAKNIGWPLCYVCSACEDR